MPVDDVLVQAGRPSKQEARHVNLPVERGSTIVFDTLAAFEQARDARYENGTLYYGRYGNAASFALENIIATLEKAAGVTLTSSGVASITLTLQALVQPGSHLLVADHVYGNTRNFCETILKRQQVAIEYFDPMLGAGVADLIREETAAIMFEAPGSGTFEFPDIVSITKAAQARNVLTVLDATWASPIFCTPLALGVDVLVYSASKHIGGHSDCMMGVIVAGEGTLHRQIRQCVMAYGDKTGAEEVFLALRGLRTLKMRMEHGHRAGLEIAQWLARQPQVKTVLHPALESCPGHEFWARDCKGAAGLFSVVFHPCSDDQIRAFVDSLHHFGIGVSWGGFESLVLPVKPVRTAATWQETGQLVRFNIGFEDIESLKGDLRQALPLLNGPGE